MSPLGLLTWPGRILDRWVGPDFRLGPLTRKCFWLTSISQHNAAPSGLMTGASVTSQLWDEKTANGTFSGS